MKTNYLTAANLRKATALAEKIEREQAELQALLNGTGLKKAKRNKRTPAQKKLISEGLRKKWALKKAAQTLPAPDTSKLPRVDPSL